MEEAKRNQIVAQLDRWEDQMFAHYPDLRKDSELAHQILMVFMLEHHIHELQRVLRKYKKKTEAMQAAREMKIELKLRRRARPTKRLPRTTLFGSNPPRTSATAT